MTSTVIEKAKIEDILDLADKVSDNWSLCHLFEGTPRAFEAEMMVAQTLHACKLNHKSYGVAFSWRGNVEHSGGGGLVDNGIAYGMLLEREYFVEEEREGRTIILMTQRLVDLLKGHLAK